MPAETALVPDNYPDRIRALRKRLGLTQKKFAEALGVTYVTVNRWENRKATPSELAWQQVLTAEAHGENGLLHKDEVVAAGVSQVAAKPPDAGPLDFEANPAAVRAVVEGERLGAGHTASPAFATEVSRIDPLPHQRIAVYERMLREPRLRLLLADDPGAGKTIMTGLYVREMLARRLLRRVLVVPPAGLVGNWQREMEHLFELDFRIATGDDARKANPFDGPDSNLVICSVDTLRRKAAFERLREAEPYDLVVFDEAHKLAVRQASDGRLDRTKKYHLAEALAGAPLLDEAWALPWSARHLLLLTATPHMGHDFPYYGLWRLLDPEVFATEDAFRKYPAAAKARYFIRRTKEEMVDLEGRPLYPPRRAVTLPFELSPEERDLYERMTTYMRRQYNQAKILNRSAAQLAMSVFQRRLASSTYALARSLERRVEKLTGLIDDIDSGELTEEKLLRMQLALGRDLDDPFETMTADEEDTSGGVEEHEKIEERALGGVTALNHDDLAEERTEVEALLRTARAILADGYDAKFEKLKEQLEQPASKNEKLLIFTEHKDTLDFLVDRLQGIGYGGRIAQIHGGLKYHERDDEADRFRLPLARGGAALLIGTDAAGEGINLQVCWQMVNYDIPWNPARLEQRMGRIHRYGQQHEFVSILNLVADNTREGRVLGALITKLEAIRAAFRDQKLPDGKVFDVVGRILQGVSIKAYMTRLVDPDADPDAEAQAAIDAITATETEQRARRAVEQDGPRFDEADEVRERLPALRADIEREQLRQLLPGYVLRYLREALPLLGLEPPPENGSPFELRATTRGALDPLLPTLERHHHSGAHERCTVYRPGAADPHAVWLRPGEPVFDLLTELVAERFGDEALRGGVFVDPTVRDPYFVHVGEVTVEQAGDAPEEAGSVLEHRLVALRIGEDGATEETPLERLLLLRPAEHVPVSHRHLVRRAPVSAARARRSLADIAEERVLAHRREREDTVAERERHLAVGFDLQMAQLAARRSKLRKSAKGGTAKHMEAVKALQRSLRDHREGALDRLRRDADLVQAGRTELLAHVLVLPSSDPEVRRRFDDEVEARAMRESIAYERRHHARVYDVSTPSRAAAHRLSDWPGFDVLAHRPDEDAARAIEVKGRAAGGMVQLTENEWSKACNLRERYWLYVVYHCATTAPVLHRIQDPFGQLIGRARTAICFDEHDIRAAAERD
ncbi:MAG: helicase-related protein [Bacteroidota bacterium]